MLPYGGRLIKVINSRPVITGINTIIILALTVLFMKFANYVYVCMCMILLERHQLILWVNGHILFWERIKRYVHSCVNIVDLI